MRPNLRPIACAFLFAALSAFPFRPAGAGTITIVDGDAAGEGFNDTTPVAAVGGNPATTIGGQRLYVFQYAANIWGSILPDPVTIRVFARFDPLSCTATSGVLGSAGPLQAFRDFPGAPLAGHWYHVALANKLAGFDLSGGDDITATFNSSVGGATCLTVGWYYGVDGNEGAQIELLPVVLHELGHGLGFSTLTNASSGTWSSGFPSIYDHFLLDDATGFHWDSGAMSDAQRAASGIACTKLVWDGSYVTPKAQAFLNAKPWLKVNSPGGIAGNYEVGLASFGGAITTGGVTGSVVLVDDATGTTTDGCEAIVNAVAGKIALIDRGTCTFATKAKNAQNAGAIGAIIVDNVAGCPPQPLGGTDPTVTIPAVRVTLADGNLIKANLAGGVNVTLFRDPSLRAGADALGHVKMYSPSTFASGSTVSHWDVSADPDLLMEPASTPGIHSDVDLTKWHFADIGWFNDLIAVPTPLPVATRLEGNAPNPFSSGTSISFSLDRSQPVDLDVYDLGGRRVASLHRGPMGAGAHVIPWDGRRRDGGLAEPGSYVYRLHAGSVSESRHMVLYR